jgi:TonB-dependent receptor
MTQLSRAIAAALLMAASSAALADSRIDGRVVSADGEINLQGARVTIPELNRSATTGADGRFVFANVPAGDYSLNVEYLGAAIESRDVRVSDDAPTTVLLELGPEMEEVLVRGMRASALSALNIQRNSDRVVSVVSSDDIGELPDANVAEALQRVPGVFLERDQGEGRYVGIRGIDPNLNITTINGLLVPAPDSGARSVALDVIPSDLVETLEVSKTFTPDMDSSGIGGSVDVRSLSAFDRQGLNLSAEYSYNDLVSDYSPKLAGSWSALFGTQGEETFGVALAFSWFDRDFGSDNLENGDGWPSDLETVDGVEFKGTEESEQRSYTINRERLGLVANFDFRTDNGSYYWRNLYSDFSDQEYRMGNVWKFADGDAVSGTDTSALWEGAEAEKEMKDRLETQEILSVLLGGENYLNTWTIDYAYGYSKSREKEPNRLDSLFKGEDFELGYTDIGPVTDLVADDSFYDAGSYVMDELVYLDGETNDEANTFKLNFTNDLFSDFYNGDIRFGALYRTREKDYDVDETVYAAPDDLSLTLFRSTNPPRYGLGEFGPGISASGIRSWFFANQSSLEIEEEDTLVASVAGDYTMNEDVMAAYLMSTLDLGDWRIVYGVRWEDTDFDATGTRIQVDEVGGSGDPEPVPVDFANSYDNWLPSINLRWERGEFLFRAAATQTIARPNFNELSPGGEVVFESDDDENVLEAELGNPLLDPVESTNLDIGFEWYPGGASVVSAGLFWKDIDNFIIITDVADMIDLDDIVGGIPVDDAEVIMPINGDNADVFGVEAAAMKQWDSGWYVNVNGTWVDTEATFPGREEKSVLPRTPEVVLNGAVGWENDTWSLRLAATFRDDALQGTEDIEDPDFDIYQDAHTQVDFTARWFFVENWQLSFTANNLTDEPYYNYFAYRPYNAQYEEYGATYTLGLRWSPF